LCRYVIMPGISVRLEIASGFSRVERRGGGEVFPSSDHHLGADPRIEDIADYGSAIPAMANAAAAISVSSR